MKLWIVTLSTPHFEFLATGRTEAQAKAALRAAWEVHAEQTGAEEWEEYVGDVSPWQIEVGRAYRDGDPL